jgi:uncharacterized membrane protein YwzB
MPSYSRKSYAHGFFLNEQELRRIHDLLIQQMEKNLGNNSCLSGVELRFRNGVISEHTSIEKVFVLENIGSATVQRLNLHYSDKPEDPSTKISLDFIDPREEFDDSPIRYEIIGDDRDWVFLTSSQLEERIKRIKRFSIRKFVKPNFNGILNYISFSMIFLLFGIIATLLTSSLLFSDPDTPEAESIGDIEVAWKAGEIKDPIEAIIRIEKSKQKPETQLSSKEKVFTYGSLFIFVAILIGIPLSWYFLPPYVFYWGENMKLVDRRQNAGKFILIGILFTILLSIASNFVYDLLKGS